MRSICCTALEQLAWLMQSLLLQSPSGYGCSTMGGKESIECLSYRTKRSMQRDCFVLHSLSIRAFMSASGDPDQWLQVAAHWCTLWAASQLTALGGLSVVGQALARQ